MLFKEHRVFTVDEMLADAKIPHERLIHYVTFPEEERRTSTEAEVDDDRIMRMITRKDVVEDTHFPFLELRKHKFRKEDSREYMREKE
mmetsp:Transcript_30022/g.27447  ORF Transcript_30022/g.27447 Transcript_30022/m.27447 type:complete len:88 (+) Transcript_30022:667-930(+)